MKTTKTCPVCQTQYMGRSNQKQCSSSCRHKAFLARANDLTTAAPPIPTPPTGTLPAKHDRPSAHPVGKPGPRPAPTQAPKTSLVLASQPEANPQSQPRLDQKERQRERDHERQQLDKQHAHEFQMAQLRLSPIVPSPVPPVLSAGTGLEGASPQLPLLLTSLPAMPIPAVDEPLEDEAGGDWKVPLLFGAGALALIGYNWWLGKPTKPTRPLVPAPPRSPKPVHGQAPVGQPIVPPAQPPLGAKPGPKQEAVGVSASTMVLPPIGPLLAFIDSSPKNRRKSKKARKPPLGPVGDH